MKPAPFEFHAARTLDEAVSLLAEHGDDCKVLAGGQSLVPMLALRLATFPHLVDINRVDELATIDDRGTSVAIGAVVRQRVVERDPVIRDRLPLLADATRFIGHFQIRNRGTIGGSLAHADAAAEYPAVALALEATMEVQSASGDRTIAADDFFQGLWTTALEEGEVLARVVFPVPTAPSTHGFAEVARRPGDFATAGAAVRLSWDEDRVVDGRLALFGVDSRPIVLSAAELGLAGATAGSIDAASVAAVVSEGLAPVSDIHGSAAYRKSVAAVVTRRALRSAVDERQV